MAAEGDSTVLSDAIATANAMLAALDVDDPMKKVIPVVFLIAFHQKKLSSFCAAPAHPNAIAACKWVTCMPLLHSGNEWGHSWGRKMTWA